ncbi:hypothetical protein, conserved [Leishmania tarentolae]|uniref:Uncharacterized protein n=1 Tax=Leishmania tarentolae TaxID=5689 RepID=A0A640KQY8_LEITA|nr:hypothetical protein, conserved [Leishmania tarentolae]
MWVIVSGPVNRVSWGLQVLWNVRERRVHAKCGLWVCLIPLLLKRLLNRDVSEALSAAVAPHEETVRAHQTEDCGDRPHHADRIDLTPPHPTWERHYCVCKPLSKTKVKGGAQRDREREAPGIG